MMFEEMPPASSVSPVRPAQVALSAHEELRGARHSASQVEVEACLIANSTFETDEPEVTTLTWVTSHLQPPPAA